MSQLGFNPFVARFVDEAVRRQHLHELLDNDMNGPCHVIHDDPVGISPELQGTAAMPDTKTCHFPSVHDAEDYIEKTKLLLESLHGATSSMIYEIGRRQEKIEFAVYSCGDDAPVVQTALATFFPKSFLRQEPLGADRASYWAYTFTPQAPFYTALTPPEFVLSPLNAIVEILASLEVEGAYQVLMMPMGEGIHERVSQAIDADWLGRLPPGNATVPPSISLGRYAEREKYKSPDFRQYYRAVVRFLVPARDSHVEQKLSAFISSYTYGKQCFRIHQYQTDRYTSRQRGFVVNSLELSSVCHVPFEALTNPSLKGHIAQTPPGQIPVEKKAERAALGLWSVGNVCIPIIEPEARKYPHVHFLGLPRQGKSCALEEVTHSAIEQDSAALILLDGHGDLYESTAHNINARHKHRVRLLDFSLDDYVPQLTLRENFQGDAGLMADEISASIKGSVDSQWYGPRMQYITLMLFYAYSVDHTLSVADVRILASQSRAHRGS